MRRSVLIVAAALLGCSESGAAPSPQAVAPRPSLPRPEYGNAPPRVEAQAPLVALDGEGLRLVSRETGAARPLPFGTSAGQVIEAASDSLGEVAEHGTNAECGEGPLRFVTLKAGLTLFFQQDRFTGWSARSGDALSTMDGLKVGLSRKDLGRLGSRPTFTRSTLGEEFLSAGVSGLMSGRGPGGVVQTLWAGTACVFR